MRINTKKVAVRLGSQDRKTEILAALQSNKFQLDLLDELYGLYCSQHNRGGMEVVRQGRYETFMEMFPQAADQIKPELYQNSGWFESERREAFEMSYLASSSLALRPKNNYEKLVDRFDECLRELEFEFKQMRDNPITFLPVLYQEIPKAIEDLFRQISAMSGEVANADEKAGQEYHQRMESLYKVLQSIKSYDQNLLKAVNLKLLIKQDDYLRRLFKFKEFKSLFR